MSRTETPYQRTVSAVAASTIAQGTHPGPRRRSGRSRSSSSPVVRVASGALTTTGQRGCFAPVAGGRLAGRWPVRVARVVRDQVGGPVLPVGVDAADVLAEQAEADQLYPAEQQYGDVERGPAGDGDLVRIRDQAVRDQPKACHEGEQAEPGGDAK